MTMRLEQKKTIVSGFAEIAEQATSMVAADYRGLTVSEMTALRSSARQKNVQLRVVRNTLARRALAGTKFECMQPALLGPVLLVFSSQDPGASARVIRDFIKTNDKLQVRALSIGDELLDGRQLNAIASLPTREEALAKLASVLQAPIVKFVRTLVEPPSKMVRLLAAIRDKKQEGVVN